VTADARLAGTAAFLLKLVAGFLVVVRIPGCDTLDHPCLADQRDKSVLLLDNFQATAARLRR
jgi:hypothetical protein